MGLIRAFRDGKGSLEEVLNHQRSDMPSWGQGRFLSFYTSRLGLRLEELAFANIAWCSTSGNEHPAKMLDECYSRHTERLLSILKPHVVFLSGTAVHRFSSRIKNSLPKAQIINILNYAHRKGREYEAQEAKMVRSLLKT
jgi:hypothetical protein